MRWFERIAEHLLRPWLRTVALGWVVVALAGVALAFKTSHEIIPNIDRDNGHLVWSAFKLQREFNSLKQHVELFDLTQDPAHTSDAALWLDIVYSRVATLSHGQWAQHGADHRHTIEFAEKLRGRLDLLDVSLSTLSEDLQPVDRDLHLLLADTKQMISEYLDLQQMNDRVISDQRTQQAYHLLDNQKRLLVAVFASLAMLFGLMWLRSKQAIWLASHDAMTGLSNRSAMIARLRELTLGKHANPRLAVHCIDLDRFKMVNDTLGHLVGDQLLVRFGRRLKAMAGPKCFVARTGANEFVLLQEGVEERADAMHLANKVTFSATNEFVIGDHQLRVGISTGFAMSCDDAEVNGNLLERADLALYEAKRRGGNTAVLFDPALQERAARHRRIDSDLRTAIQECQLVNFYQPKIDLATRRVCGAEALLRWIHPEHGMIRPDHFIPIAEDTRLIIPIGAWAANQACADAKAWTAMARGEFHIAVNLSPVQFENDMLVSEVRRAIKRHDLDPRALELEITESTLMDHNRQAEMAMKRLRDVGVRFALDDFGTGYSSLSYLDRFRFDKVKIDRSFVMSLDPSSRQSPIIEAVVHMSKGYDFEVCAEGIEDEAHAALLTDLGCHEAQGYLFGKPMPADEFTVYLAKQMQQSRRASDTQTVEDQAIASTPQLAPT